jgi:hypothetical protein
MSNLPPIAQYGFVSDCEHTCLITPDGSVERPALPVCSGSALPKRTSRTSGDTCWDPWCWRRPTHLALIDAVSRLIESEHASA